jgi:hypothetical protein
MRLPWGVFAKKSREGEGEREDKRSKGKGTIGDWE